MIWALLIHNDRGLTSLWSREDVSKAGRVKASPWDHCIGDLRLCGGSTCCCIDHPKILLPSQWGDIQILPAEADGGSGFSSDRGGRRQGALHSGRGVRRGSFGINLRRGCCWTHCEIVYCGWSVCFRAAAGDYFHHRLIIEKKYPSQFPMVLFKQQYQTKF